MAGFEAIFVKINGAPTTEFFQNIKSLLRNNDSSFLNQVIFRYHENYPWIQIQELPWLGDLLNKNDGTLTPKFAALLSKNHKTDVICIYGQTVVDAYGYWHFKDGEEIRCLIYGFYNERIWEEIRGSLEGWEEECFFNLKEYEDILSDEDELSEKVIKLCETKQIEAGSEIPFFTSQTIRKIAEYFQLPGISNRLNWSLQKEI